MTIRTKCTCGWLLATVAAISPVSVQAEVFRISPSEVADDEEFENIANRLMPGDELVLADGVYAQSGERRITVNGTMEAPIIIRAAEGANPILTRSAAAIFGQYNLEIVNSSYLEIRGLHLRGGITGIVFFGGDNITIEDCEVFETANNAIAMNRSSSDGIIIRGNHLHHTGQWMDRPTEGEGIYIGCHDASCAITNSLFEGNYIHHTRATSSGGNDGIEIKAGSYGNIIRGNVIHDTNIGREYPCIFAYGGGPGVNIIEGNAMWNCGEAIQVVSDAIVRNNIILNSSIAGIIGGPHKAVPYVGNVKIINNTIFGHPVCANLDWNGAVDVTFANNAAYCPGAMAISAQPGHTATIEGNLVNGAVSGVNAQGYSMGGPVDMTFVDAANLDFWPMPGSGLLDQAVAAHAPELDFNRTERTQLIDIGAYEAEGQPSNPGRLVQEGVPVPVPVPGPDAGVSPDATSGDPDAGVVAQPDASTPGADAGAQTPDAGESPDSGVVGVNGGGCACISTQAKSGALWGLLLAGGLIRRRRR